MTVAVGENDGTFKGRRYMFTPHNHAKFFRVRDLTSVLDVKVSATPGQVL